MLPVRHVGAPATKNGLPLAQPTSPAAPIALGLECSLRSSHLAPVSVQHAKTYRERCTLNRDISKKTTHHPSDESNHGLKAQHTRRLPHLEGGLNGENRAPRSQKPLKKNLGNGGEGVRASAVS